MGYYKILLAGPAPVQLCSSLHSTARGSLPQHNAYNTPLLKTCQSSPVLYKFSAQSKADPPKPLRSNLACGNFPLGVVGDWKDRQD